MPDNEKVMLGNHGHWVRVKEWGTRGEKPLTYLGLGEDGETVAWNALTPWDVFQVIQKLAETSGLFLDKTGAQGLIITRPTNPREEVRREDLASQFSRGEWEYKDLPDSTKLAINHILTEEIKRGDL